MVQVAQVAVCSLINTKHINTVWAERTIVECWCITFTTSRARKSLTLDDGADM